MVEIKDYIEKGAKTSLWTIYRKIFSNHENLGVEIQKLFDGLKIYETNYEDIEDIIKGLSLWAEAITDDLTELEKAKNDFMNRKIVEELKEDNLGDFIIWDKDL